MKRTFFKAGQKFGPWTLKKYLGGGGNGEVWRCENSKKEVGAIKLLKWINKKSYARFRDETVVLEKNKDVPGIIPIIDKSLPVELKDNIPYFVMSVAESSEDKLFGRTIEEKISAILEIAETLKELHKRDIAHRDIKPPNILFYRNRFSLADFGLVDYPNKEDISDKNEQIGAKWTIAPEMRRTSSTADPKKADVYSLAKTMWIILTENQKGFDGQYSAKSIIELRRFYPKNYTTPIDTLLTKCTDNDPDSRPSIDRFIGVLKKWQESNEDFAERNVEQWFEIQNQLFPTGFPSRVIWEDKDDIIRVLKIICSYSDLNHMFFPNGGGLDLEDARASHEKDCIELDFQLIDIVKPKRLLFESFGHDAYWNYFRLELDELEPTGIYKEQAAEDDEIENNQAEPAYPERDHESIAEIYPGQYDRYEKVEYRREYIEDGEDIPETARTVTRWFRGAFVIFSKASPYNMERSTYDGRHNKMSSDEFRAYIKRSVEHNKKSEK